MDVISTRASRAFRSFHPPHQRRRSHTAPFALFRTSKLFDGCNFFYPRTTRTLRRLFGVRAPRDGLSPERKSRRRGGLPIPPRVSCLPALPLPLTACLVMDSLDIVRFV